MVALVHGKQPNRHSNRASAVGENNTLPRFPKGGLWLPKASAESMITLEAIGVAELPAADPLTGGLTVVACQLLRKQRRLPDDVDGAGLRCRRRSLRLRRSNASCTGLGSSDEANSGEQRNDETHRHPPMERRHRAAGE